MRRVLATLGDDAQTLAPIPWFRWVVEIMDRDYDVALQLFSGSDREVMDWVMAYTPLSLLNGWAHHLAGNPTAARAAFDSARTWLEPVLEERPDDPRVHSALGLAHAGLGRADEAVREGRRAVDLLPVSRDAVIGPWYVWELSIIYATTGDADAAVAGLDRLLSRPGLLGPRIVLRDPRLDPIRGDPGFQALEARYLN
jgi:serine/threonine-protein kinase